MIVRYLCGTTGETISLLPEGLIPRRKYDIQTCLAIKERIEAGESMQEIASDMSGIFYPESEVALSASVVFDYLKLFRVAALRHRLYFGERLTFRRFIPEIRKACREFYSGTRFLFGIPSQGIRDGP